MDDPIRELIPWLAACGVTVLMSAAFFERLIPIVPSYALLVVIGIATAEGHFSLPSAIILTALGSVLGCLAFYAIGIAVGEHRSRRVFEWPARLMGISSPRFGHWVERFRANEQIITFGAQLVPTVRLFAPGISGLLRTQFWHFAGATALGATLWNVIFISVGYAAASSASNSNASALALKTLVALVIVEVLILLVWKLAQRPAPTGGHSTVQSSAISWRGGDGLQFLRAWISNPLRVAAVAPSGPALAKLITSEITDASSPVIELGPGTGAFTKALLARGVPEDELTLIEYGSDFARLLDFRFPAARVFWMDASKIADYSLFAGATVGAVVSGLPVLSMPPEKVKAILSGAFIYMRPGGSFYQFTYGPRCPVRREILEELGLEATRIGHTMRNLPPASVYRITRRK